MGTTIDSVAVTTHRRRGGALELTDAAGRDALGRAGLTPADIDLLVNVGLFHDGCLGEPALAALVQEDVGAHPEDPHGDSHGTFSFDVANGACGLLTGIRIAHGFLAAGTIRHALIVAGDARPGRGLIHGFPYAARGAAIVLGYDDGPSGATAFRFGNELDGGELSTARVRPVAGRNRLVIEESAEFAPRAGAWAGEVTDRLLRDEGLTAEDVDVVVTHALGPGYLDALAAAAGLKPGQVVADDPSQRVHTAGLAVAWEEAGRLGRLPAGSTALLVSAGAGLTAGAALYRAAA
jgi:3-oxoacyl-[acyl-carrier-protein] synthase-3